MCQAAVCTSFYTHKLYVPYDNMKQRRGEFAQGPTDGKRKILDWNLESLAIESTCQNPRGSDGKESPCNVGNPGSVLGSGRSPREGNGYPCQYSSLENSINRRDWWDTVHGVTKSWTLLSN